MNNELEFDFGTIIWSCDSYKGGVHIQVQPWSLYMAMDVVLFLIKCTWSIKSAWDVHVCYGSQSHNSSLILKSGFIWRILIFWN